MPNIKIAIRNKIATNLDRTEYICGNSDFVIDFDFDAEWDAYETKTVRFIYGGSYQDIIFQGSQCAVPVISNTNTILCGVYAGDLHTTTPALIPARKGILCGNPAPADPAPDVYAQIMELINSMGEVDPEAIAAAVAEYMAENPAKETDPTVSSWAKQPTKPTYTAEEVGALPKDTKIPVVPTNVSAFANDAGYLTKHQNLDGYAKKTDIPSVLPNPQKLTFTGEASGIYDGSKAVAIKIPEGTPSSTAEDAGKFLRVSATGTAVWETVASAEGTVF